MNKVIGVYGISGAGKSHVLAKLKDARVEWRCVEGSQVLRDILKEDGLSELPTLSEEVKERLRLKAVNQIQDMAGITIVTGHASFPFGETSGLDFENVFTKGDGETYDAIFYLDKAPETVYRQRNNDARRKRANLSIDQLRDWIQHEKTLLSDQCARFNIPFHIVDSALSYRQEFTEMYPSKDAIERLPERVLLDAIEAEVMTIWYKQAYAQSLLALKEAVGNLPANDVYLLIDGDRTLSPQDTGRLFFDELSIAGDPLKDIFQRRRDYNFGAFVDVARLYASTSTVEEYKTLTNEIGSSCVQVYEAWKSFLLDLPHNVCPILLSCSTREIWQAVVEKYGLGMHVIAGNHTGLHDYLIDEEAKGIVAKGVHSEIGRYLAYQALDIVRDLTTEKDFPHVQGFSFRGPAASSNVVIMPLMRGGDPMSRGVYEVFPRALLVHHYNGTDVSAFAFRHGQTLFLVDSVVNTGRSLCTILDELPKNVRAICIAGVMQEKAAKSLPVKYPRVRFLSLRISNNQYTGKGGTDTGNRLFGNVSENP